MHRAAEARFRGITILHYKVSIVNGWGSCRLAWSPVYVCVDYCVIC